MGCCVIQQVRGQLCYYFLLELNEFFPKSCIIDGLCLHFFTQELEELGNPLEEAGHDGTRDYRPY